MSPTESLHKPLPINRHVIFRNGNVFFEGRIVDVLNDGSKTLYSVLSFATFEYFRVTESDLVTQASLESKRKYKPSTNCGNFTGLKMPSVLKNRLRADKDYCMINYTYFKRNQNVVEILRRYNFSHKCVKEILTEFSAFFLTNSLVSDSIEINEVVEGFTLLFNTFLPVSLLYEKEKEFLQIGIDFKAEVDYAGIFGPVHLLRLLYFLQKHNEKFNETKYTQMVLSDFVVYLIDFLNFKYQEYFYD